jgi:hypothetical protein
MDTFKIVKWIWIKKDIRNAKAIKISNNLMLKVYTIIHFIDGKEMKNKWSFGFEHAATEWSPTSDRNIFVRYNYFILNVFKLFIYLFI